MHVLLFGQQNWTHCWTAKQHLATRLAQRGHRVLYVDPDWDAQDDGDRRGISELGPGALFRHTYRPRPWLGWRLNQRRRRRQLRACVTQLGLHDAVALIKRPDVLDDVDVLEPAAKVYYAVDEWSAFGGYSPAERAFLRRAEERTLRAVDVAIGVSPRLHRRFQAFHRDAFLLPNGADIEHFGARRLLRVPPHPHVAGLSGPRLGFVGQIDERIDQDLLLRLADERPHWQIVLAGRIKKGVDVGRLAQRPNVHLLGYQSYEDLPGVLREIDVCLVPYRLDELTESCSPLKVYEYLATGRPVVSVPLDGLGPCREVVVEASTPTAFLQAVDRALGDPDAGRQQRLAVAERNRWDYRVEELERCLELARVRAHHGRGHGRPPLNGSHVRHLPERPQHYDDYKVDAAKERPSWLARSAFEAARVAGWLYHKLRVCWRVLRRQRPFAVRRIMVVRHCYLGDLIAILPTLAELRARFPHAHISLGVQPRWKLGALLEGCPNLDEVVELGYLESSSRLGQLQGMVKLLLAGYDVVLFGLGFFMRREALFAGAPLRIGLYNGHPAQRLHTRVVPLDTTKHEVDANLALVEVLSNEAASPQPPRLWLDEDTTRRRGRDLLAALGVPERAPVLAVHAGSRKESRRWPIENFRELVIRLRSERPDLHLVFLGVADEAPLVRSILDGIARNHHDSLHDATGRTDLVTLVGVLQESKAALCNDSGIMHLARTVGTPLLALLGPENDRRWGPYHIGEAPTMALRYVVPCAPCRRHSCAQRLCMRSLPVGDVLAALRDVLAAGRREERIAAAEPLQMRRVYRGWEALADAGFELPTTSVVLFSATCQRMLGRERRRPDESARLRLRHAVEAIAAQSYPHLDMVVVGTRDESLSLPTGVRLLSPNSPHLERAWDEALRGIDASLVLIADSETMWPPDVVADLVAALQRRPEAAVAYCGAVVANARLDPGAAPVIVRADALRSAMHAWRREQQQPFAWTRRHKTLQQWLASRPHAECISMRAMRGVAPAGRLP